MVVTPDPDSVHVAVEMVAPESIAVAPPLSSSLPPVIAPLMLDVPDNPRVPAVAMFALAPAFTTKVPP
jgi:hypothetical protein